MHGYKVLAVVASTENASQGLIFLIAANESETRVIKDAKISFPYFSFFYFLLIIFMVINEN